MLKGPRVCSHAVLLKDGRAVDGLEVREVEEDLVPPVLAIRQLILLEMELVQTLQFVVRNACTASAENFLEYRAASQRKDRVD